MDKNDKIIITNIGGGIFQYFISFNYTKGMKTQPQGIIFELIQCGDKIDSIKCQNSQKIDSNSKTGKKVKFVDKPNVKIMYTWSYAHRQARTDKWQQIARDNGRFDERIAKFEKIIAPILRKKQLLSIQI